MNLSLASNRVAGQQLYKHTLASLKSHKGHILLEIVRAIRAIRAIRVVRVVSSGRALIQSWGVGEYPDKFWIIYVTMLVSDCLCMYMYIYI